MRHFFSHAKMHTDRRSFLLGTAGAFAGLAASLGRPGIGAAKGFPKHIKAPLPPPKPILGGPEIPGTPPVVIHEFLPGPVGITLPFTGLPLEGLDVEPSTITDFKGFTALAYHAGTATGSDGKKYNLETDIRVMEGEYVGEDGRRHEGTFAEM
jgi:hypothetical protein